MTARMDIGEPKLSGGLESETKRSHRMSRMRWVMLSPSFRPGCLYTMELPTNYCNVLLAKPVVNPLSRIGSVVAVPREMGQQRKVEIDEEHCRETLSCFSSEISQGYI